MHVPSIRTRRSLLKPVALLVSAGLLAASAVAVPVRAAAGLTLTTPYPGVTASPDSQVSFDLAVDAEEAGRIDLEVTGVPASWSASLHGGGFVVTAVQLDGSDPVDVRLDVDVPADATGTTRITVVASDAESRVQLPLDIRVEAGAEGEVRVEPDFAALRGASDQTFTFNINVSNETEQDQTYSASGQGPAGWEVEVELTGQSQAVSGTVQAGGTSGATVRVTPAENADAGAYPIQVVTTVGADQFPIELSVEITGNYSLSLSTETGALSARGPSGSVTEQKLVITNTGTAPVTGVTLADTLPSDWTVVYDPPTIATIEPDAEAEVTARITPSGDAIAGDYELTIRANGEEADDSVEIRFTVEASILGAVLGALLIVAAFGGLWWVFRRYGRR
jgi:uncharacterized repeat protein (TIGR01451 family)